MCNLPEVARKGEAEEESHFTLVSKVRMDVWYSNEIIMII